MGRVFILVLLVLMFGGPHTCSTPTARNNPFHIKSPAALLLVEEDTRCFFFVTLQIYEDFFTLK